MLGVTKVKIWAVVDEFGDIKSIEHKIPELPPDRYVVPMTLTLGHNWREGFSAWFANARAWF